jgi:hypothetical protein
MSLLLSYNYACMSFRAIDVVVRFKVVPEVDQEADQ